MCAPYCCYYDRHSRIHKRISICVGLYVSRKSMYVHTVPCRAYLRANVLYSFKRVRHYLDGCCVRINIPFSIKQALCMNRHFFWFHFQLLHTPDDRRVSVEGAHWKMRTSFWNARRRKNGEGLHKEHTYKSPRTCTHKSSSEILYLFWFFCYIHFWELI